MAWVTECPKCGKHRVYNHDAGTCYVCTPAPKEEEMDIRTGFLPRPEEATERRATELRAVYERAYFAALGGYAACGHGDEWTVKYSRVAALETVRQWPAMQAELEQEIAK